MYMYITHSWEDEGIHTYPKSICLKVNVIQGGTINLSS